MRDSKMFQQASDEQIAVIKAVSDGNHVTVDAVAGSGKTTTVLLLAKALPHKKILQVTYNSMLKLEVRQKVAKLHVPNIDVHTYHSLCVAFYDRQAFQDAHVNKIISANMKPKVNLPSYDIVIVDEVQDMTLMYYQLIHKFIIDLNANIILVLLGDRNQGVYQFKGADSRFLTLSDKIWPSYLPMCNVSLSTSYRVTSQIAWFVNAAMLGEERITSHKTGDPITYIRCNPFDAYKYIVPKLLTMLRENVIKPDDIFVLAPSIKCNVPIKTLENALVLSGITCYMPLSDEVKLNDDVMKGKVTFSSFHQSKGRERPVVIVYNFDESYFQFYAKDMSCDVCPPTLYVAVTRASKKLLLVASEEKGRLPFLKNSLTSENIEFVGKPYQDNIDWIWWLNPENSNKPKGEEHRTCPTDLVKFLKEDVLQFANSAIEILFKTVTPKSKLVEIPSKIQTSSTTYEEVSELNALTITTMWEAKQCCDSTIFNGLEFTDDEFFLGAINKIDSIGRTPADFLYLANIYTAITEKVYFKLKQITTYDWLTTSMVNMCHDNMRLQLTEAFYIYERNLIEDDECDNRKINGYLPQHVQDELGKIKFKAARVDMCSDKIVWELKCVNSLTTEHFLQVVIYAWLWKVTKQEKYGKRSFLLFNIRTGEVLELDTTHHLINELVYSMLMCKFGKDIYKSDAMFMEECLNSIPKKPVEHAKPKKKVVTLRQVKNVTL